MTVKLYCQIVDAFCWVFMGMILLIFPFSPMLMVFYVFSSEPTMVSLRLAVVYLGPFFFMVMCGYLYFDITGKFDEIGPLFAYTRSLPAAVAVAGTIFLGVFSYDLHQLVRNQHVSGSIRGHTADAELYASARGGASPDDDIFFYRSSVDRVGVSGTR